MWNVFHSSTPLRPQTSHVFYSPSPSDSQMGPVRHSPTPLRPQTPRLHHSPTPSDSQTGHVFHSSTPLRPQTPRLCHSSSPSDSQTSHVFHSPGPSGSYFVCKSASFALKAYDVQCICDSRALETYYMRRR